MAAALTSLTLALTSPPVRVISWPPARADAAAKWIDGVSCGPLGHRIDALFQERFSAQLERELAAGEGGDIGVGGNAQGYARIIRMVHAMSTTRDGGAEATASASRRVLQGLFPDWPPGAPTDRVGLLFWFGVLFARPLPAWSARLNAWVTWWAAQWLMGPCSLEDLSDADADASTVGGGTQQQVLIHRCRFLEEAACVSVCVNACKMPTQAFFVEDMQVPLRIEPDYETLQCRFKFGLLPTDADEAEARNVACFAACPSAASVRDRCHSVG
eukprot:CAMPEP_0183337468 /NCGR_PEP_ID=MMETSP0164_2-20130417/5098_1 /TAXON_ID=221442 /ORGANISM="Coccolithus pelagicus ssp braarudi, Strain PLY182g" /LENGTH=271 /DNA_ID=CAMNT_0025507159 /DNA_START=17 /DNA_END=832 /DNA_ORIENTATION=-